MEKIFCYALIDLISQNKRISIQTIVDNARKGNIIKFIDDLGVNKYDLDNNLLKTLNESIRNYDFDAIDNCQIDFSDNGLLKLLSLIINYELS